jgi:large subunit ribosomal protein L35
MPKLKSRKAAAFKSHLLEHKSSDRRRKLSQIAVVDERDEDRVRGMLPYL